VEVYLFSILMNYEVYFIVALRHSGQLQVQAVFPSVPTAISHLKPCGNFMDHRFYKSKIINITIT
jgi:hypothetical protein